MSLTIESLKQAKKQAKSTGKPVKITIGNGLRVNITQYSAVFQLRYRMKVEGVHKERTLTLGKITARNDISLNKLITETLDDADEAKKLIRQGLDPVKERQIQNQENTDSQSLTTQVYFTEWVETISKSAQWSQKHYADMQSKFKLYIASFIGSIPINRVKRINVAGLLEKLENRPSTYKKVRGLLNQFFEDAATNGRIEFNPTPRNVVGAVRKHVAINMAAIREISILQNILAGVNKVHILPEVREAAILQAHTALRSQSVVAAKWEEFDFKAKLWRIPRTKGRIKLSDAVKYGTYYTVPLSEEITLQLLKWQETLRWKKSEFLFPSNAKQGHITTVSDVNYFGRSY